MSDAASGAPLHALYDAGLFDLDGVVYRGGNPVPHASRAIAEARAEGMRPVFVTNNAARTPATVAAQLSSLAIPAKPGEILGSAHVGVELAEAELGAGARVLLCGGEGLREAAKASSLVVVESAEDKPDGVIHGFSPETDWRMLSEAVMAISGGARYIATNLDRLIPRERGLMMGVGSLAKAVEHATGVAPVSGAKPDARMFRAAAAKAGATAPLVVGDNLDTDILGAANSGYASLHVLTGTHCALDAMRAEADRRPRYLAFDLKALASQYPRIRIGRPKAWYAIEPEATGIDHDEVAAFVRSVVPGAVQSHAGLREALSVQVADSDGTVRAHATLDADALRIDGRILDPRALADSQTAGLELTENQYRAVAHLLWAVFDVLPHCRESFENLIETGAS